MGKQTKKDIIQSLINAGASFDEIVAQGIAKESYVKTMFTQNGLTYEKAEEVEEPKKLIIDPQDLSEDGPELPEGAVVAMVGDEVIKGFSEDDIVEVATEDIPEDAEIKDEPLVIEDPEEDEPEEEDPLEENYKECFGCLERVELKNMPYMTKARCKKYVDLAKQVLITKDLKGTRLQSLNARYNYIIPRPAGRNSSTKVLALHRAMTKLFRAHYKK